MKTKVAVVGCGMISEKYLENICSIFKEIEVVGLFDLNKEIAKLRAEQFSIGKTYDSYDDLLSDSDVELVLNLTNPTNHYELNKQALEAKKHVYCEKPLATSYELCEKLLKIAEENDRKIGCSPDTVLGSGIQTARKLIEDGYIGRIIGATANMIKFGVETWHPNPIFLYQKGAGPLHDMGPYYISALIHLIGPIKEVSGMSKITAKTRTITSQPKFGQIISVDVPTHIVALISFCDGTLANFTASFDVQKSSLPFVEIYGTEGTLALFNPNDFSGNIKLFRREHGDFLSVPNLFGYSENVRSLGFADMAKAIATSREIRANGKIAAHVIEVLDSILLSSDTKKTIKLKSTCDKPLIMANTQIEGILD